MSKQNKTIDTKYNLSLYWQLLKKYKHLLLFLALIILTIEAINLTDKFLFKLIIDNGTQFLANQLPIDALTNLFVIIALIFLSLIATKALLKWLQIHLVNILDASLIADIKRKFFNHIITLSYHFHTTHRTGSLISRLVRGGRAIENMTDAIIFQFAPLIFQLLIISSSLLYFDKLSALILIVTIILFITYSYFLQTIQQKYNIIANDAEDLEKAHISDFFTNIDSIKYFGKEKSIIDMFQHISQDTKQKYMTFWNYYRFLEAGQALIIGLGTFFLLYFPLQSFLNNSITLGTISFIYATYIYIIPYIWSFIRGMREYYKNMADFESLFQYYKIKNEIKDAPNAPALNIINGRVQFKNLTFGYHTKPLFHNFNLTIEKNKKVALVGHSGSGKTTLIKLLYRLYDLRRGAILIDNINIKNIQQESLRSELSIVPQECILFDDTIYNNIAFSNPHATRDQVFQAIEFAQLDKLIKNLPKKENTIVGERGIKLSGGEKQRVSIARALLANKKILLLDEATSSLDSKTESQIQHALKQLMHNRTTIIIAHRLSTIMTADKIVVLDKGNIVQQGTHKELIKQTGVYKELWNLQKGGYIQ